MWLIVQGPSHAGRDIDLTSDDRKRRKISRVQQADVSHARCEFAACRGSVTVRAIVAATAMGLCACGIRPTGPAPEPKPDIGGGVDPERIGTLGELFQQGGVVPNTNIRIGAGKGEALTGAPVNRHIWRAAIDTLAFLPIASTDPYSGVIATDWGAAAGAADEQVKVTAFVTGVDLSPATLRVAVFRQVRDARGAWVAAPVSTETAERVEDAILTRARQLRLEEESAGRG